jgi:hypothetical protein
MKKWPDLVSHIANEIWIVPKELRKLERSATTGGTIGIELPVRPKEAKATETAKATKRFQPNEAESSVKSGGSQKRKERAASSDEEDGAGSERAAKVTKTAF